MPRFSNTCPKLRRSKLEGFFSNVLLDVLLFHGVFCNISVWPNSLQPSVLNISVMRFWSQVSDEAAAERHTVGGDGRSRDDRHRGSRRRKPEGNRCCSVPLQRLTSVPSSWCTGEFFPLLWKYIPRPPSVTCTPSRWRLLSDQFFRTETVEMTSSLLRYFTFGVTSAGGARGGASDWFSAYAGLAAGSSHPIQQRGAGDAPTFSQEQPGGGAVDQRQTGERSENPGCTVDKLEQSGSSGLQRFYCFLIWYMIERIM